MTGPHWTVAAVRSAIRADLVDLADPARPATGAVPHLVLAACSGGPDSIAVALGLAFVAPRLGLRAGALTVDHDLQAGSARRAATVAQTLREAGLDPVEVLTVAVGPSSDGPEAAARTARYTALEAAATRHGAAAVLLGHTRDDQAETVLLGLARGSGTRSLAGMAARRGVLRRPLLHLDRTVTADACAALGARIWVDPHNTDDRFTRSRVRARVLPLLEAELGPGIAAALARTADLARADADALDTLAADLADRCAAPSGWRCAPLAAAPGALRHRVLRSAALGAGCPASDLRAGHVAALDALVTDWHGQGTVDLPGAVACGRRDGLLRFDHHQPGMARSAPIEIPGYGLPPLR